MTHLADIWEGIADRIGDQPALIHGDRSVNWRDFEARAARLASALSAAGLGVGSKIAIDLYNCNEWLEAFFAAIKVRAVPANVNYRYLDDELIHILTDSHAEALIFHAGLAERILRLRPRLPRIKLLVQVEDGASAPLEGGVAAYEALIAGNSAAARIPRTPDDPYLSYTGGTTGLPKGVMVGLGRAASSMAFLAPVLGLTPEDVADPVATAQRNAAAGDQLIALPASPLMHSTGFSMTAIPALTYGGAVVTLTSRSFDPREACAAVERHGVRLLAIVGDAIGRPILHALEEGAASGKPFDMSSIRLMSSAGVAWSAETKRGLFAFLPQATLLDACGASEGLTYGFRSYRKGDALSGTNFTPAPGLVFLDPQGEPGPAVPGASGLMANSTSASGYYNDPEKTARTYRLINGMQYVAPGDYGRIEADGTLTLLGRGATTINTGGEKVHPEEVEDVIRAHADVDDCLVLGMPDERFGQRVTALVQPREGRAVEGADIVRHTHARLAGYKAPKQVLVVARIPRGPNGKADYEQAKAVAAAMAQPS
ncbi:MAG: AMP-binding protein [Caulobacteraceae bacterium]|nr:AMP-binding protein [Caulobacteraceae bacterium]